MRETGRHKTIETQEFQEKEKRSIEERQERYIGDKTLEVVNSNKNKKHEKET